MFPDQVSLNVVKRQESKGDIEKLHGIKDYLFSVERSCTQQKRDPMPKMATLLVEYIGIRELAANRDPSHWILRNWDEVYNTNPHIYNL